jgi:hypothetical protein
MCNFIVIFGIIIIKNRTIVKKIVTIIIALFILGSQSIFSQALFEENFNYNAGDTLVKNGWTAHSGAGTNTITVVLPGLSYSGYASSGVGFAAKLVNSGEDVNRLMSDSISTGSAYISFLVRVDTARSAGDYFFNIGPTAMGSSIYRGRVYVKQAVNGKLSFGVSKGAASATVLTQYTDSVFTLGTTHLIVLKYTIVAGASNDSVSLFVDPVISGSEPAPLIHQSDTTSTDTDINVARIALRQGSASTAPYLLIDGIRVANSWSSMSSTVPVELTSFTATSANNGTLLKWRTATETNNYGFNVERKASNSSWENIAFVKGNGTSSEVSNYSFTDKNAGQSGKVSYRLKQVDFDGSYTYSKTVEVNLSKTFSYQLGKNYPNPFNPSTIIKYSVPVKQNVTLKVYNLLGNLVATLVNETKEAGDHSVEFNAKNLSSGVYYYQLQAGNFVQTNKMILMK